MKLKYWLGTLAIVLSLSLLWGLNEYQRAEGLKLATENQYSRSFADFIIHLDGLETSMAKSKAAGTPTQQVFYLSQSWHQSETAVKDLSLLPAQQYGLAYVNQFLNEIGEFTHLMTQQVAKGGKIDSKQEVTFSEMHERLLSVNRSVQELNVSLNSENISWLDKQSLFTSLLDRIRSAPASAQGEEGQAKNPSSVSSGFEQLDATLQKFPPFSYEGQTDTHSVAEPLGLPQRIVSLEEAKAIAADFLITIGYSNADPLFVGTSNGTFAGFIYKFGTATVDICKKGGVITLFRDERALGLQKLNVDQTSNQAMEALRQLGWKNFVLTATSDFGGYIQLDAVNEEQGVRIYPDKIRLTVAKDNGSITGYDTTAYWSYHHERSLTANLSQTQALSRLRSDISVREKRLSVIALPGWQEAFCYEFRGNLDDEDYLIYINALDGIEEKIQRIIQTPRGEFLE